MAALPHGVKNFFFLSPSCVSVARINLLSHQGPLRQLADRSLPLCAPSSASSSYFCSFQVRNYSSTQLKSHHDIFNKPDSTTTTTQAHLAAPFLTLPRNSLPSSISHARHFSSLSSNTLNFRGLALSLLAVNHSFFIHNDAISSLRVLRQYSSSPPPPSSPPRSPTPSGSSNVENKPKGPKGNAAPPRKDDDDEDDDDGVVEGDDNKKKPLSYPDRFRRLVKKHGKTAIVVYFCSGTVTLSLSYLAVSFHLDVPGWLATFGMTLPPQASTFIVAYALHKLTLPARLAFTAAATPTVSKYLKEKFPQIFF